jgi:hypothetical protein
MPILNNIANAFLGATQVSAIYRGAEKIWPSFTGLLDLYPNAAVAYSLRRLRSGYTGSAIRVRRSSDSAEQDIGFVSNVLDTASLLTFVGAGDGFVTTWYDQSGLGLNATQTTAGVQPEIVLGGVLWTQNGNPAVRFLDPSGPAAILDRLNVPLFHVNTQAYIAYFWSYAMKTNGTFPFLLAGGNADRGFQTLHFDTQRRPRIGTARSVSTTANALDALVLDQSYIRTDTANRLRIKTFINDINRIDVADSNTNFNMPTVYFMGNASAAVILSDLLIQEFVAYTYDVDASISAINGNLNGFYGAY